MRFRTINDTVRFSNGNVATGVLVSFTLEGDAAFTTDPTLVIPTQVQSAVNYLGALSVSLWCNGDGVTPSVWRVDIPGGETLRFVLNYETGVATSLYALAGASLVINTSPMDDTAWGYYKQAVTEYNQYRPLLSYAAFVPSAGVKAQTPPAGVLGIESIAYGLQFSFSEVMDAQETEQGWCFENGILYLSPAPVDTTAIPIIWRKAHQPAETSRTYPTIAVSDLYILQLLADAYEAETATSAVEMGLSGYTIGGTSVKWSQAGGNSNTTSRSARLRSRAATLLGEPLSQLG